MSETSAKIGAEKSISAIFLSQAGGLEDKADQEIQEDKIAAHLAEFIAAARYSIDIAIYDFRLSGKAEALVIDALDAQANKGVTVRIAYDHSKTGKTGEFFAALGSDPAPEGTHEKMAALHKRNARIEVKPIVGPSLSEKVALEPIETGGHLMHSKYVLRDAMTPRAAVLMGSANFTDDAWALQENNILAFESAPELARFYANDFGEMWDAGKIANSGRDDSGAVTIDGVPVAVMFSPGQGQQIDLDIARRIGLAKERVVIASMVISSGNVLGALSEAMHRVKTFKGIYDATEMDMVTKLWERAANHGNSANASRRHRLSSAGKAALFEEIAPLLHAKRSEPYKDKGPHNFMHDKLAVVDDLVITGSFNFSLSATHNAENIVVIESRALADAYAGYVDTLLAKYPAERS